MKKKLLYIHTSPNLNGPNGSLSNDIGNKVLNAVSKKYDIEKINLDEDKYFWEPINSNNLKDFFDSKSNELIKQLEETDVIVISVPTINFCIPSMLKNYFDRVLQANKTFKYKYDKGKGKSVGLLPKGKKAVIINTQGSPEDWYPFTSTSSSIEGIFKFIGIKNIKKIQVFGTKTPEYFTKKYSKIILENDKKIKSAIEFLKK